MVMGRGQTSLLSVLLRKGSVSSDLMIGPVPGIGQTRRAVAAAYLRRRARSRSGFQREWVWLRVVFQ